MTRLLYTATIPEWTLVGETGRATAPRQLAKLAALSGDGSVTATGSEPNEVDLSGQIRGKYGDRITLEVIELLDAPGFEELPFTDPNNDVPKEGYFVTERPQAGRVNPQSDSASTFEGTLVQEGTRRSHRREVRTTPTSVKHQFGTSTDAPVGIPASASKVIWIDEDRTQQQTASPDATLAAENGGIDQYRADTAPYANPRLAYDLAYDLEGDLDAAVFDTYGDSETVNGTFVWAQVFSPTHEYRGEIVFENGLIRLTIDEPTDPVSLTAEEWDDGASSWTSLSLGTSDWALFDVDIRTISAAVVRARMIFEDTTSSSTHTLDVALHRGWDRVQFIEPEDSDDNLLQGSQAPQGLVDLLDPIAANERTDPEPTQGLIARSDIPV